MFHISTHLSVSVFRYFYKICGIWYSVTNFTFGCTEYRNTVPKCRDLETCMFDVKTKSILIS